MCMNNLGNYKNCFVRVRGHSQKFALCSRAAGAGGRTGCCRFQAPSHSPGDVADAHTHISRQMTSRQAAPERKRKTGQVKFQRAAQICRPAPARISKGIQCHDTNNTRRVRESNPLVVRKELPAAIALPNISDTTHKGMEILLYTH